MADTTNGYVAEGRLTEEHAVEGGEYPLENGATEAPATPKAVEAGYTAEGRELEAESLPPEQPIA